MMALFTTNRWGEVRVQPSSSPLALQQLHRLAQQRKLRRGAEDKSSEMRRESSSAVAEERAELTGGTAPAGERNLKKKNKRSGGHSGATVEGTPSSVTEEGRGLEAAAVAVSTDKQRRKLRTGAREDHTSSSSTESGSSLVCEEMATEAERSDLPSVKRRRRGSGGTVPGDRSDLVVSEARTAVEGSRLTRGKEAVGSRDGGEGLAEERTVEEEAEDIEGHSEDASVESDRDGPLALVTRPAQGRKLSSARRQLPEWVLHPHLVEADIRGHSRPLGGCGLPEVLLRNLQRMGYSSWFPVQANVIPELLSSLHGPLLTPPSGHTPRDICVCAPTGCGKTLCYVVPIACALLKRVACQVRALVVLPSQDLVLQVYRVFQQVVHGTGISIGMVSGQDPMSKESAMLLDPSSHPACSRVDVVVATPGRLVDHLKRSSFATLQCLRFLVIDEADKLLDQRFQEWLPRLLEAVHCESPPAVGGGGGGGGGGALASVLYEQCSDPALLRLMASSQQETTERLPTCPRQSGPMSDRATVAVILQPRPPLQKLLLSATMTLDPEHLSALGLNRPQLFSVAGTSGKEGGVSFALPPQLEEHEVHCSLDHKPLVLLHLLTSLGLQRVLCFTNSRKVTHRLCLLLQQFSAVSVAELSGSLSHRQRRAMLRRFRTGKAQVLVCSDAMARGMDVEGVEGVVSYQPPARFKTYLHRVGRTARAGQRGVAYTFLAHEEVAGFHAVLRKAGHRRLDVVRVEGRELEPLLAEYEAALGSLREQVRTESSGSGQRAAGQDGEHRDRTESSGSGRRAAGQDGEQRVRTESSGSGQRAPEGGQDGEHRGRIV